MENNLRAVVLRLRSFLREVLSPLCISLFLAGCGADQIAGDLKVSDSGTELNAEVEQVESGKTAEPESGKSIETVDITSLETGSLVESNNTSLPSCAFPRELSYSANTIKPNHRSQLTMNQDVALAYDDWKFSYLKRVDNTEDEVHPFYRVSFGHGDPSRTVSEGQGYGMIFAAAMAGYDEDAQTIFDGLWRFNRAYPSDVDSRLMSWSVPATEQGGASAFDGDIDMAWALILADAQWGSAGEIHYREEAVAYLQAIRESTIGPDSFLPMLGDWVTADGATHNQYTPRSSDLMPSYFRAFNRYLNDHAPDDATDWLKVLHASSDAVNHLQANYSATTGLLPDFTQGTAAGTQSLVPASASFLEGDHDGHFFYNAGRVPLRLSLDALISGDAISHAQTSKIAEWITSEIRDDAYAIKAGYTLEGEAIGDYFSSFFVAPFGVAMMTSSEYQLALNAVYDAVYAVRDNYYEDSISLLSLLVMSGNYWDPTVHNCGN